MEYFELIRVIELDVVNGSSTAFVRIELMRSSSVRNKYRARLMHLKIYNLYPTVFNTGPKGEDLHHFHSSDMVWSELPVADDELGMGFLAGSEDGALERAVRVAHAAYDCRQAGAKQP